MEIIKNTDGILNQLANLIQAMNQDEFTKPLHILSGSTVGQHIRHILEFYVEFVNGYDCGTVCYDNRKRNLDFETNQAIIISKLNEIINMISECDLTKDLKIKSNHGLDENEETISNSSVMRELVYALDHTVHHLAIIKIAMQVEFSHITLNENMGVAPSTLRNNKKICVQ